METPPENRDLSRRWALSLLSLIVIAGTAARLHDIGSWDLVHDEIGTVRWSRESFAAIMTQYTHHLTMHLYILVIKVIGTLFGRGPIPLILPSAMASIALILVGYVAGARLSHRLGGLISAALIAGSGSLIQYAATARVYSLSCLIWFLGAMCLISALRTKSRNAWLGWSALTALALMSSLQGVTLAVAQALGATVAVAFGSTKTQRLKAVLHGPVAYGTLAAVCALAFYAFMIEDILAFSRDQRIYETVPFNMDWLVPAWKTLLSPTGLWLLIAAAFGLVAVQGHHGARWVLGLMILLPLFNPFLCRVDSALLGGFHERFLIPLLPVVMVLAGVGLATLLRRFRLRAWQACLVPVLVLSHSLVIEQSWSLSRKRHVPPFSKLPHAVSKTTDDHLLVHGPLERDKDMATLFPELGIRAFDDFVRIAEGRKDHRDLAWPISYTVFAHVRRAALFDLGDRFDIQRLGREDNRQQEFLIIRNQCSSRKELAQQLSIFLIQYVQQISKHPVHGNRRQNAGCVGLVYMHLSRCALAAGQPSQAALFKRLGDEAFKERQIAPPPLKSGS